MRCLPALSLIFWFPAASCVLLYPCCWPRRTFFPSSCHPSSTTAFTWAFLVLLHWRFLIPCFPQAARTHQLLEQASVSVCEWDHYKFVLWLCSPHQPALSVYDGRNASHEILGVWNTQIFHAIISARSSSPPGTYRPEHFPEKLKSSVEKECGKSDLSSTSGSAAGWW